MMLDWSRLYRREAHRHVILDRYIVREVLTPLGTVSGLLVALFVSYTWARYLADAIEGLLAPEIVWALVLLRAVVALELLLPITLYLSVVLALGRLHTDQEMVALAASGVSPLRVVRTTLVLALVLGAVVAVLSLAVRPWAYEQGYRLRAKASGDFDLERVDAGRFYRNQAGGYVVFVDRRGPTADTVQGIFIQRDEGDRVQIISARQAHQVRDARTERPVLVLEDGHEYRFTRAGRDLRREQSRDRVLAFRTLSVSVGETAATPEYRRKAASTAWLLRSPDRMDAAELQWRLFTPVSAVLLALLAVPLSHAAPRQGRQARVITAILIYAAYYFVTAMAKTWIERGLLPTAPGLWTIHAGLAIVIVALLWPRALRRPRQR
jgi:lipopolysaccharide export system permease protein